MSGISSAAHLVLFFGQAQELFGNGLTKTSQGLKSLQNHPSDNSVRVLELGSGVGFLAALLAAKTKWSVTASDYEPAYATYLAANCELHGAEKIPFETLDWCEAAPAHLRNSFDIVVACDVLYDDSHLESLPRMQLSSSNPMVLFCWPTLNDSGFKLRLRK